MDQSEKSDIDAGIVMDGVVNIDSSTGDLYLRDSDGQNFPIETHLKSLLGKEIRFTCIKLESMENLMDLLNQYQGSN
jgi:hypothetical protein